MKLLVLSFYSVEGADGVIDIFRRILLLLLSNRRPCHDAEIEIPAGKDVVRGPNY